MKADWKGVQVSERKEAQAAELFYRSSQVRRDDQDVESEVKTIECISQAGISQAGVSQACISQACIFYVCIF